MNEEIVTIIVGALSSILLAIIGAAAEVHKEKVRADRKKIENETFGGLLTNYAFLADMLVLGAEELAKHDATIDKFNHVKEGLLESMRKTGIDFPDNTVDLLVDAAVKRMKDAGKEEPSMVEMELDLGNQEDSIKVE